MREATEAVPVQSLEDRLDALETSEAARCLLARYALACDAQDLDALSQLLSDDSRLEVPGRSHDGRDAVIGFYRGAFQSDPSRKRHFITNVETRWLGPGRVAVDSYFLYTAAGDTTSVLGWGDYRDIVRRDGAGATFELKSIAVKRAVDVRDGWADGGVTQP